MTFGTPVVEHWLEREKAKMVKKFYSYKNLCIETAKC